MKISGTAEFNQPVEMIWKALHDPKVLSCVIPGCKELTLREHGTYEIVMKLGIAAVKGEYSGMVTLQDVEEPVHYVLHAEGSGTPGYVKIDMDCDLQTNSDGTHLRWDCQAEVGGAIASVGNRVLAGIAKFMAAKFFKDIEKEIGKKMKD